jgi:hypothetical protein
MIMKFRKRIRVLPGVTLNLSKSGISTTVGVRGASVNMNRHGAFLNTGIPGTGLYDRKKISGRHLGSLSGGSSSRQIQGNVRNLGQAGYPPQIDLSIFTSIELKELHEDVRLCFEERNLLFQKLLSGYKKWSWAKRLNTLSKILIFGLITGGPKRWMEKHQANYLELLGEYEACRIDVGIENEHEIIRAFEALKQAFINLSQCANIWDVSHYAEIDSQSLRTEGSAAATRIPVRLSLNTLDTLQADSKALKFENADGGDFYLYPALVVMANSISNFALIGYSDLTLSLEESHFMEIGTVPSDTEILRYGWFRANKDGSADRRFRDNFQIPVCRYGKLIFEGKNGIKEIYLFSNFKLTSAFFQSFSLYRNLLIGLKKS